MPGLEWDEIERVHWDPKLHPRVPGGKGGGEFASSPTALTAEHGAATHMNAASGSPGIAGPTAFAAAQTAMLHAAMSGSRDQRFGAADSLTAHTLPDGSLDPERARLHQQIVDEALAGHKPSGGRPVATFLGGGSASGKSALRGGGAGSVRIDSDEVKGHLPEYQQGVKDGDQGAAAYAHEESSKIAKDIQAQAIGRGLDFTLDGTGDNSYEKMRAKVAAARKAGYQVNAQYVTADVEEAIRRARARAEKTGRMVPESTIRSIHAAVSATFAKLIEGGDFDGAELWDTNGPKPKLVGRKEPGGAWQVEDERAWQRFLAKAA